MGRKNKTKLLKHGSQSLNASTIAESDGRSSSNDNHQVEFEALSSQLREFVSSGSNPERHRDMRILFSTLEKRDAELIVAKQLIKKLRSGLPVDHSGDGDSTLPAHEDTFSEHGQNGISIIDELDHLRGQNGDLMNQREKLTLELVNTEENVARLKDQVNALESKLDLTNSVLEEGSQTSAAIIDELEQSLRTSNEAVQKLTQDIESQKSSYRNTCSDLQLERERLLKQEELMVRAVQVEEELRCELDIALKRNSSMLQRLASDNEKLESRYESINNGVQLIKKDFDEVKRTLVKSNEQVNELQQQLTATKADVKHYRDNEDACRKYIKKLEDNIQLAKVSTEQNVSELEEKYAVAQKDLQTAEDTIVAKTNSEQKLLDELQDVFQTEKITNVLEAVVKLRENFRREQHKLVFQSAALEGKDVALQKLLHQNKDLLDSIDNDNIKKAQEMKIMEEDRKKVQEELDQAKQKIKKLSKEKNQSSKRLKNLLAEKFNLIEQNKSLEDKLNQSTCSQSNESVVSENSDSMDLLEESVKSLKSALENTEGMLSQVSTQLVIKEEENLDLHRTVVAYKSKIDDYEKDKMASQKTLSKLESLLEELQKSSEVQQKQYEEDSIELRQKLKLSEMALQEQQDLYATANVQIDKLKEHYESEKHSFEEQVQQLRSTVASFESEKLRVNTLVTSIEEDKCKILKEKELMEAKMSLLQEDLHVKDRIAVTEKLAIEESLRRAEEESNVLKESLEQMNSKMAETKLSQAEKETTFVEMNQQLESEIEALRTQIMKQDVEIEKLSLNAVASEQQLEGLTEILNQKEEEHQKALQSEKAKFEIIGKKLDEMTAESSEKVQRLKEKEQRMEELRVESENASQEMRQTIQRKENELAQVVSEKVALNSEMENFKILIAEKEAEIVNLFEDKTVSASEQQRLENEVEDIKRRLEEAMSPKKDRVVQLENRIEVLQTASKAQNKRLEDELHLTRVSLELSSEKAESLEKQISELQQHIQMFDEVQSKNVLLSEELAKAVQLTVVVSDLEKQNKDIQLEAAEERAGLVNELIDAKQKLAERDQQVEELQQQCKLTDSHVDVEAERPSTSDISENHMVIDSMFPTMDPAVRQLVILLSENRNYSYGVLGLVVYGFLVHLYILWY